MRDDLERRLSELREEYRRGKKMLADLQQQEQDLRSSLLRIGGAIQVLEELLTQGDEPAEPAPATEGP